MRRGIVIVLMTVALAGVTPTARQMTEAKQTIEGELVDGRCYLLDAKLSGAAANDHLQKPGCGTQCLEMGLPAGLVSRKDKKFYVIVASSISLASYLGQTVRVTGRVRDTFVLADTAEVQKDGKWEEISLAKMM